MYVICLFCPQNVVVILHDYCLSHHKHIIILETAETLLNLAFSRKHHTDWLFTRIHTRYVMCM